MYGKQKILTPKCFQKQGDIRDRKGSSYGMYVCAGIFAVNSRYENGISGYVFSGHQCHTEIVDKIHVS